MTHFPCGAVNKLAEAIRRTGSQLSVGLEPCAAYLPAGFSPDVKGYERFLRTVIDATVGIVAAYKFNLAFFEALGPPGWELLFKIRRVLPDDVLIIADAKRGDIGTTAEHYARALYDELGADSATVNPLMGRDSAEPFLAHADKLTYFLVLTSNPGAQDFLIPGGLYRSIASGVSSWNSRGNCGAVVGATRPGRVAEIRGLMPEIPFLIPGIGAQGGDLEVVAREGRGSSASSRTQARLLFHVTRGVLPLKSDAGDASAIIRAKTGEWNSRVTAALDGRGA
jgi:orotidine-5'-phosphate decarboxylase